MEFTTDFPFIRKILKQEHARARDEIRDLGQQNSWPRHEPPAYPIFGPLSVLLAGISWRCTISRSSDTTRRRSRALFSRVATNSHHSCCLWRRSALVS